MIVKAMGLGFLLWLATTLVFRLAGQHFFDPYRHDLMMMLFVAAPIVMAAVTWLALKLLREERGDEAEAAGALAAPGMLLNVYAVAQFQTVYPNLDVALGQDFGALMLLAHGAIVLTGLFMTKLAPKDEQL